LIKSYKILTLNLYLYCLQNDTTDSAKMVQVIN